MKKIVLLGIMVSLLAAGSKPAGAIGPGDIFQGGKDVLDVVQAFTINDKREVSLGQQIHPHLLAQMGGEYPSNSLKNYVNRVGQNLVKFSGRSNIPYHFTVVNADYANAFAIPGGYVYVTRGLLKMMRDEAELASVLGHEIGHVVGKHGVIRMKQVVVAQKATKYVGKIGEAALNELTNLFANLWISGYGRKNELDADRLGLTNANTANYDPNGSIRLFEHFKQLEKGGSKDLLGNLFASHPPTDKRIKLAREEINKLAKKGTRVNKNEYLSMRRQVR